jgi:FAD/FMN-containing dehydrogenase
MAPQWHNWSGSVRCAPASRFRPREEAEVCRIVRDAAAHGRTVRAVGAGHSSHEMLRADDVMLSTRGLSGVVATDRTALEATVKPGTTLERLGQRLHRADLALPNYGDVATQTIGGAVGTATHGTGPRLQNLSQLLVGGRFVDGRGAVREFDREDTTLLRAAQVSLGTLGVFTELRLRLVPAFDTERREYAVSTEAALETFELLSRANRSVDFYWYPRRDDAKLRLVNPVGGGCEPPCETRLLERREGYSHQVIPTHSGIAQRFEECEYAVPAAQGIACFRAVRARILRRWRHLVAWRVLYRTVAADDAFLSPEQGRDSVSISLHQNSALPWQEFFNDIEPLFLQHGGRPHWAKKHGLRGEALARLYPHWRDFHAVRESCDPKGTFLSPQLRALFGLPA